MSFRIVILLIPLILNGCCNGWLNRDLRQEITSLRLEFDKLEAMGAQECFPERYFGAREYLYYLEDKEWQRETALHNRFLPSLAYTSAYTRMKDLLHDLQDCLNRRTKPSTY